MSSDKKDPVTSEFLDRLEQRIKESQGIHGEVLKPKWEALQAEINTYFQVLEDKIVEKVRAKKQEIITKIEDSLEKEAGFVDWEKTKAELNKQRENFQNADQSSRNQAFDTYHGVYTETAKKIESALTKTDKKINESAGFVKFDKKSIDIFFEKFENDCNVLVSDFVSHIGFFSNELTPEQVELSTIINLPHKGCWRGLCSLEKQELFIVGGLEGRISLWDSRTLQLIDMQHVHESFITSILYIPEQQYLVTGGAESRIGVMKLEGRSFGKQHITYIDAGGFISYLCYIDDENLFASVGGDSNVRIYDPQTLDIYALIPTSHGKNVPRGGLVYAKEKKLLICGYEDGTLDFYSIKKRQIVFGIISENKAYWGLLYNAQNMRIYAHTTGGVIKVWNFEGERPAQEDDIKLSEDGDKGMGIYLLDNYMVALSNSNKVAIYDMNEKKDVKKIDIGDVKGQIPMLLPKEKKLVIADETCPKLAVIKFK